MVEKKFGYLTTSMAFVWEKLLTWDRIRSLLKSMARRERLDISCDSFHNFVFDCMVRFVPFQKSLREIIFFLLLQVVTAPYDRVFPSEKDNTRDFEDNCKHSGTWNLNGGREMSYLSSSFLAYYLMHYNSVERLN